jgi:hypothetical protein
MAPFKPSQQNRFVVDAMEKIEARLGEQLKAFTDKLSSFDGLKLHQDELDQRVSQCLNQVQAKMDLSLVSLGQVQHDQAQVGKDLEGAMAPPTSSGADAPGPALLGGPSVLGAPPGPPLPHLGARGWKPPSRHQRRHTLLRACTRTTVMYNLLSIWMQTLAIITIVDMVVTEACRMMSTHAFILVDSVGPPSAEVCRTAASFP